MEKEDVIIELLTLILKIIKKDRKKDDISLRIPQPGIEEWVRRQYTGVSGKYGRNINNPKDLHIKGIIE